jgi:hypothetical protein
MLLTVINNIISFALTLAIVFIAPIMIAYAGFLYVINAADTSNIAKARGILWNVVRGIVIALAAWMIVDALMAVLYNGSANNAGGTWASIVTGGDFCINQAGVTGGLNQVPTNGVGAGGPQVGTAPGPCSAGNTACSTTAIQQASQALGMSLNSGQLSSMSCIAMTESSGNPNTPNSNTGACGTFQITTQPGNWSNPAYHQSPCNTSSSCNNAQCNLQTALIMFGQQSYQPWTGKNPNGQYWNANAVACVKQYDPAAGANL